MSGLPNTAAEPAGLHGPTHKSPTADPQADPAVGPVDFAAALARLMGAGAAPAAHTAAAQPTAAAEASDPLQKQSALDELTPEFRARLERVIARMEALGHTVEVVETYRDQERQDFLYEQGRSRSGPVVTWTRDSNHTRGRAADLRIDGTFNSPAGYRTLAIVAEQEGLHTLGPHDAGHVELPRGSADGSAGRDTQLPARTATAAPVAGVAPVATVAPIARVAPVAAVAEIAAVAPAAHAADAGMAINAGRRAGRDSREEADSQTAQHARGEVATHAPTENAAPIAGANNIGSDVRGNVASALERTADADIASRVARVLDLQDAGQRQPLSSVVLRLGGSELSSLIRVARRGSEITSTIDVADPLRAQELRGRLGELRSAIEAHGLRPELTVQATSQSDTADLTARLPLPDTGLTALADAAHAREVHPPSSGERPRQEHNHTGDGQQRHRPRREHHKQEER